MEPSDLVFLGKHLSAWIAAGALLVGVPAIGRSLLAFAQQRVRHVAERTELQLYDVADAVLSSTRTWVLVVLGGWAASRVLGPSAEIASLVSSLIAAGLFVQAGLWATALVGYALDRYRVANADSPEAVTAMGALGFLGRVLVWTATFLLVLDNLGFDVTALITGLGVGGIAVALAVQNVLGDLLASVSIVVDKPFVVGDFIAIDDFVGVVETVGLKTTRLRSLSGEQIVMANSDLLQSRIRNYKRAVERRNRFTFGVTYDTTAAELRRVAELTRAAIEAEGDRVRFDRAHFVGFGDSSLDFEAVWFTLDADYSLYMDQQQRILLRLLEQLTEQGIGMAFPTRTVHLVAASPASGTPT